MSNDASYLQRALISSGAPSKYHNQVLVPLEIIYCLLYLGRQVGMKGVESLPSEAELSRHLPTSCIYVLPYMGDANGDSN